MTVIPLKTIMADKHSEETHPPSAPEDCTFNSQLLQDILQHQINSSVISSLSSQHCLGAQHFILYHFQQSTTSGILQRQSILQSLVLSVHNTVSAHSTSSFIAFNGQPLQDTLQRQPILQSLVSQFTTLFRHTALHPLSLSTVNHFRTPFNANQFFSH
jgi:hypothetical protein